VFALSFVFVLVFGPALFSSHFAVLVFVPVVLSDLGSFVFVVCEFVFVLFQRFSFDSFRHLLLLHPLCFVMCPHCLLACFLWHQRHHFLLPFRQGRCVFLSILKFHQYSHRL